VKRDSGENTLREVFWENSTMPKFILFNIVLNLCISKNSKNNQIKKIKI